MAKHRDLASIVYASTLGRASASKIWKTVVFSGAMLAASPASADNPCGGGAEGQYKMKAPDKAPVKEVRTAEQINADIADRDAKIKAQIDSIIILGGKAPAAEDAALKTDLDKLVAERKALRAELKALKIKSTTPTSGAVVRAELALTANETKQIKLAGKVVTAKTLKLRGTYKTQLETAIKDREKLDAKLLVAREDAAKPRPRTPPKEVRPVGRGFILS
jgi:hypothetical protein